MRAVQMSPRNRRQEMLASYPAWAQDLARRYLSRTISQFILHGNVRDLVPVRSGRRSWRYMGLRDFLIEELFASRDGVLLYDRGSGLRFSSPKAQQDFRHALAAIDLIGGTSYAQQLPREPSRLFPILEQYFRLRLSEGRRIACILDFAETLVPQAEPAWYSAEERALLVTLQRWASDPLFLEADFTLVLITENLADLARPLVQSPHHAAIRIPLPDEETRLAFIRSSLKGRRISRYTELAPEALAALTAGLRLEHLRQILADAIENRHRISTRSLIERKKELIQAEAYGLLEFVETPYTLDMVAGHRAVKALLRRAAEAIRQGRRDVLPMGYLVTGPVGTGKTFLISCFAGEIGIPMVRLRNFRSQWQGVTEGNLEKILGLLEAMNPVAVLIDEADAFLGDRHQEGDSGVSSRVFAMIASFMSNTAYRGRIIWFLLTARPDLMPVDLKRQGRAEEHLALFYPQSPEERQELFWAMVRKTGAHFTGRIPARLLEGEHALSGADMEALLVRAKFEAASRGQEHIDESLLEEVLEDFLPPTYPLEVELQTLVAVLECTRRSLLPPAYRDADREGLLRRVRELKRLLGES